METHVFLLVMLAALLHAGWNALIKLRLDPLLGVTFLQLACALVVLPLIPFATWPADNVTWLWAAASIAIHTVYYLTLSEAYRAGDLGQVYPIARGTAPLLTATGSALFIQEWLSPWASTGLVILACGIALLSRKANHSEAGMNRRALFFALMTAVTIATYSIVDGLGTRAAGNALTFIVILNLGEGLAMLIVGLWAFGSSGLREAADRKTVLSLFAGGAMGVGAYGIALWAMLRAPIALVAALRETSVLFAAMIGVVFLREPLIPVRIVAAGLVVLGLALLRFG